MDTNGNHSDSDASIDPSIELAASDERPSDERLPGPGTERDGSAASWSFVSAAGPSETSLLPDLSAYDLTINEALALFPAERRKTPSIRTLQRYCREGQIDCYKLKTTRNGNPVHEWIINSASLRMLIQSKPEEVRPSALTPPEQADAAIDEAEEPKVAIQTGDDMAATDRAGGATDNLVLTRSAQTVSADKTSPDEGDDANGGDMNRVELLIENAKLTAGLEAQVELVNELRDDKRFMRDEITQHRQNDRLLADMHRETLQTLKAVAVAGRHTKIELPGKTPVGEGSDLFQDVTGNEQDDQHFREGRV